MYVYKKGDVVTIRDEHEPAMIVEVFDSEDEPWYEVKAINLPDVPHREVKGSDLHYAHRIVEIKDGDWRYFDSKWNELNDGDVIEHPTGEKEKLYRTREGMLGTDATNPAWIKSGRAVPCQFGIYPLGHEDVTYCVKV